MYSYDYSGYDASFVADAPALDLGDLSSLLNIFKGVGILLAIIPAIILLIMLICQIFIFIKAGEKGWKAIIPVYNIFVWHKIIYGDRYGLLLWWLTPAAPAFTISQTVRLCSSFGKEVDFAMGCLFLPIIFYPILAFGKSEYLGPNWSGVM